MHLLFKHTVLWLLTMISCENASRSKKSEDVLVDHRGKPINTDSIAKQVVILEVCTPPVYYAVDGSLEHLVNTTQGAFNAINGSGFYTLLLPEFKSQKATAGINASNLNIEEIIKDSPDVVFQSISYGKSIELMDKMRLNVVGLDGSTMQKRRDFIKFCGAVSGKSKRADQLVQLQIDSQNKFNRIATRIYPENRVSIVNISAMNNNMQVAGKGSIEYDLVAIDNPAEELGNSWIAINIEQLLIWNPDILLISSWLDKTPKDFYQNPLMQELSAIKNKCVYKVPQTNRFTETIEVFLIYEWLWRIAYGDFHFAKESFRTMLKNTFATIYGKTIDDKMMDILLEMDYNKEAKDYQMLFGK